MKVFLIWMRAPFLDKIPGMWETHIIGQLHQNNTLLHSQITAEARIWPLSVLNIQVAKFSLHSADRIHQKSVEINVGHGKLSIPSPTFPGLHDQPKERKQRPGQRYKRHGRYDLRSSQRCAVPNLHRLETQSFVFKPKSWSGYSNI